MWALAFAGGDGRQLRQRRTIETASMAAEAVAVTFDVESTVLFYYVYIVRILWRPATSEVASCPILPLKCANSYCKYLRDYQYDFDLDMLCYGLVMVYFNLLILHIKIYVRLVTFSDSFSCPKTSVPLISYY
jgi:hypothetical protein